MYEYDDVNVSIEDLDRLDAQLDSLSAWPWETRRASRYTAYDMMQVANRNGDVIAEIPAPYASEQDLEFIAIAPNTISELVAMLRKLLKEKSDG